MHIFTFVIMYGQFCAAVYMGAHYGLPDRAFMEVAVFPLLPHLLINMFFMDAKGWGLAKALGKKRPAGLSPAVWVLLAVSFAICMTLVVIGYGTAGKEKLLVICGGMVFSIFWSVLIWFTYWKGKNRTVGQSAAYHMLNDGRSQEEIDRLLLEYKEQGLITS